MKREYAIGIDIGGQTTKLGIVSKSGAIVAKSWIETNRHSDSDKFVKELISSINTLAKKIGGISQIRGIGVGAPNGNYYSGVIEYAVNLKWGGNNRVPISKLMIDQLRVPVTLTNDANAAAMGELKYGVAQGMKHFIMITLGTGVGSGIVIDGRVLYGHDGFAGELGHTFAIKENGRACTCGRVGCLETYLSARGIVRTAREMLEESDTPSLLRTLRPSLDDLTSQDVGEAAAEGDALAVEVFEYSGKIFGESLSDFVSFSAPEAIILFGGVTNADHLLIGPTKKSMECNLLPIWQGKIPILKSTLPESDAAILGAAALVV